MEDLSITVGLDVHQDTIDVSIAEMAGRESCGTKGRSSGEVIEPPCLMGELHREHQSRAANFTNE